MIHGETLHSTVPWDIPWWNPDHAVFFSVLYLVLFIIGNAVGFAAVKAFLDCVAHKGGHGAH
jgi:SNF family Na+-dependent transporter